MRKIGLIPLAIACFLLLKLSVLNGQDNIYFKNYDSNNGLRPGTATQLWKDPLGYLWLLSENGLSRFDGYEFINFRHKPGDTTTITSAQLLNAYTDSAGHVFFLTSNSLLLYHHPGGSFEALQRVVDIKELIHIFSTRRYTYAFFKKAVVRFDLLNHKKDSIPLPEHFVHQIWKGHLLSGDTLMISTRNKVIRFDLSTMIFLEMKGGGLSPADTVLPEQGKSRNYFFRGSDQQLYLSTYRHLYKYQPGQNSFAELPARHTELNEERVSMAYHLRIGDQVYSSSPDGKVIRLDLLNGTVKSIDLSVAIPIQSREQEQFRGIVEGLDNNLWVQTSFAGIIELDRTHFEKGIRRHIHTANSSLPSNNCGLILDDPGGVLWIFSPAKGLIKGEKIKPLFKSFTPGSSDPNVYTPDKNIRALLELDSNRLLLASLNGTYAIDLKGSVKSPLLSPVSGKAVLEQGAFSNLAMDPLKRIWISGWNSGNVFLVDRQSNSVREIREASSLNEGTFSIRSFCFFGKYLYLGTSINTIFRIPIGFQPGDSVFMEKLMLKRDPSAVNLGIIFTIKRLANATLLIGSSNGMFSFNTLNDSIVRFENGFAEARLFNSSDTRSVLIERNGDLWIGTNGNGLFHLDNSRKSLTNYSTENGLSDNSVYTILKDKNGKLWMGTNSGINRLDPSTGAVEIFSEKDGATFHEYNTNAAIELMDGRLAFGGINGLIVFHPDSVTVKSAPADVLLTHFFVNNRERNTDTLYELKHHENYLSFQFSSLSFLRNEEIKYAYMLEGLDEKWTYCGTRRFTTYANLKPGHYTFLVKSSNANGRWSDKVLRIGIYIRPPWYFTWYAITGFVLLNIGILLAFYRYRYNQRMKLQKIRDNIARDLHDEIGSNLSSISIFNEVARENAMRHTGNIVSVLDKIGQYTQISQEAMNDIVWMIDSKNDRFENIIIRMRTLASETIGSGPYHLHLNIDESLSMLRMEMARRKNFYLIYKEGINNLLKYAECKNVWIDLYMTDSLVTLMIKDDGKGFDPGKNSGNGLVNMKKRAAELKGELSITSSPDSGTTLLLKFHL